MLDMYTDCAVRNCVLRIYEETKCLIRKRTLRFALGMLNKGHVSMALTLLTMSSNPPFGRLNFDMGTRRPRNINYVRRRKRK